MSRAKYIRRGRKEKSAREKEWPIVVYIWVIGLAIVSYAVARVGLDGQPHPYHWLSGLVGGLAGIPIGWLWYRWRGDVL